MDQTPPEQPLVIMAQYIKDFSFENPNAPGIYQTLSESAPEITVNIDVTPLHLENRLYEVVLSLRVSATCGETVAFLVELDYAALVNIGESVAEEALEPLLFSETPRHLYPFARSILAMATRDAAFPPLFVNPVDFESFYQRNKKGALAKMSRSQDSKAKADVEAG